MKKIILLITSIIFTLILTITTITLVDAKDDNKYINLDHKAITYSYVAYGNTYFIDQDHNGHKINLFNTEDIEYDKGITFHGYAVIRYDFDYNITAFSTDLGLNDCDRGANGTSFKIKIIAAGQYVYESEEINQNNNFLKIDIKFNKTNTLIIILDPLGNNQNDRVSLGNPLVRKEV